MKWYEDSIARLSVAGLAIAVVGATAGVFAHAWWAKLCVFINVALAVWNMYSLDKRIKKLRTQQ